MDGHIFELDGEENKAGMVDWVILPLGMLKNQKKLVLVSHPFVDHILVHQTFINASLRQNAYTANIYTETNMYHSIKRLC